MTAVAAAPYHKIVSPALRGCPCALCGWLCALQTCAQVLLTLENLADRSQYVNARNTFTELLAYGTIPVVNENVSCGDTCCLQP
jgi:hypothetical protein